MSDLNPLLRTKNLWLTNSIYFWTSFFQLNISNQGLVTRVVNTIIMTHLWMYCINMHILTFRLKSFNHIKYYDLILLKIERKNKKLQRFSISIPSTIFYIFYVYLSRHCCCCFISFWIFFSFYNIFQLLFIFSLSVC